MFFEKYHNICYNEASKEPIVHLFPYDAVRGLLRVSKYYACCSYISPMHQITTNAVIVTKVSIVIP